MFSRDRDLLVLEPTLFRDIGFLSQRLLRTTGAITAGLLEPDEGDFLLSGVRPGHVALVNSTPVEIVEIDGAGFAAVSLPRPDPLGEVLLPLNTPAASEVLITTFDQQRAIVHRHLLSMLGIGEGGVAEDAIMNPRDLRLAECLGTLHLIYIAAAAPVGTGSLWTRAEMYRARYEAERRRVSVRLDLDGDGEADATRALSALRLVRA